MEREMTEQEGGERSQALYTCDVSTPILSLLIDLCERDRETEADREWEG